MIKPKDIIGSSVKDLAIRADTLQITFSNHYKLTASLAAVSGEELKERYRDDIVLAVNDSGEGILIRFLRRWPLLIGVPEEPNAGPAIMTLRQGAQVLTWHFDRQDAGF